MQDSHDKDVGSVYLSTLHSRQGIKNQIQRRSGTQGALEEGFFRFDVGLKRYLTLHKLSTGDQTSVIPNLQYTQLGTFRKTMQLTSKQRIKVKTMRFYTTVNQQLSE